MYKCLKEGKKTADTTLDETESRFELSDRQLSRSISFIPPLFFSMGTIIGSGWLLAALAADAVAGPAAVISWVVGGVFMMLITLLFVTLFLVYFSEYGPLKTPSMHFPYPDLIEAWMGIVAYAWDVKSGYATRKMTEIVESVSRPLASN